MSLGKAQSAVLNNFSSRSEMTFARIVVSHTEVPKPFRCGDVGGCIYSFGCEVGSNLDS